MKTIIRSALAGAVALGLSAGASLAQEVTLRCQHFLPPMATIPKYFITPWAEKVMADSNGRIKVEVYPAMQLGGKPPALYDQIRDGVIDCGWTLPGYTPGRFPETEALELPFLSGVDAEASSKAAWAFAEKYLTRRMSDVHLLAFHVHGPGVVHKKGTALTSVADFDGLKLRGPTRQANALLKKMGATPVGMPVPAFPEALSKGVVDGGVIPYEVAPSLKVQELTDSQTEFGGDRSLYTATFIFAMNKASYDRLPDDLKAVIDANSGEMASAWAGQAMVRGDTEARAVIVAAGNEIVTMDGAELAKVQAAGEEVVAEWVAEMDKAGLPGQAMVDDARALMAEYND